MRFFLSHSSRDKSLVREIRGFLPSDVQTLLDDDRLVFGDRLTVTLKSAIQAESDYLIIFLGERAIKSDWVKRELRWALEKETELGRQFVLPILVDRLDTADLPAALRGRARLECFDQSSMGMKQFGERLGEQLKRLISARQPFSNVLERGESFGKIFDAALDLHSMEYSDVAAIKDALPRLGKLDERLLYADPVCAREWLQLCKTRAYDPYRAGQHLIEDQGGKMVDDVWSDAGQPDAGFDFVSLGPGDGVKDMHLLQRLTELTASNECYYYPIDISFLLLQKTLDTLERRPELHRRLLVKAVHGDFLRLAELRPLFQHDPRPNVFSLLGNTLGNFKENSLINYIKAGMSADDYLIVEVFLAGVSADEGVKKRFFRAPLQVLGMREPKLTNEDVTDYSDVPSSETTITTVKSSEMSFELTVATRYDLNELGLWFEKRGFNLVSQARDEKERAGLLAVRRSQ